MFLRNNQRSYNELRDLQLSINQFGYADYSVIFELGNTKVQCAISLINKVPLFLRDQKTGWLTAEYSMLPTATLNRIPREIIQQKRNHRSIEISRLIGRSLRSITNLKNIPDKTIHIDCDVLQADAGTRVAAISGACFALKLAQDKWLKNNIIKDKILIDDLSAISIAIVKDQILLDPDYKEDSAASADFNFILTSSGKIVEIQGTSETQPMTWENFDKLKLLALSGTKQITSFLKDKYNNYKNNNLNQNYSNNLSQNKSQLNNINL